MSETRKGKGFDAILASNEPIITAAEAGAAIGAAPGHIRAQARKNPAALGFPVTVVGTRVYIPRIPFLKHHGLL